METNHGAGGAVPAFSFVSTNLPPGAGYRSIGDLTMVTALGSHHYNKNASLLHRVRKLMEFTFGSRFRIFEMFFGLPGPIPSTIK